MIRRVQLKDLYPQKSWLPTIKEVEYDLANVDAFLKQECCNKQGCCYPVIENVFAAFECLDRAPSIVLVGQDPYPNGLATGIAFQTKDNAYSLSQRRISESLGNGSDKYPDWNRWIDEFDVLSMNVALTYTRKDAIRNNLKTWKPFTQKILKHIARLENPPVVILFGREARKNANIFTKAITSFHPAAWGRKLETTLWDDIKDMLGNKFESFRTCTVEKQSQKRRRENVI